MGKILNAQANVFKIAWLQVQIWLADRKIERTQARLDALLKKEREMYLVQ